MSSVLTDSFSSLFVERREPGDHTCLGVDVFFDAHKETFPINIDVEARSVAILLCTHNGERFLRQQLDSIASQTHANWRLFVSDDGSTDQTLNILREFSLLYPGQVDLRMGPKTGQAISNFLSLACNIEIDADFFAFCDQDDIWLPQKLERALTVLQSSTGTIPSVYGGRTIIIDEDGKHIGFSPLFQRSPSFQNALVQNIAGGNTMVFNRSARDALALAAGPEPVMHDWWVYQLITGVGGQFFYDPQPFLEYRQHGKNLIGSNRNTSARFARLRHLFGGRFQEWRQKNAQALHHARHLLTPDASRTILELSSLENVDFKKRIFKLWRSGVYRQSAVDMFALYFATMFRRT